MKKSLLAASLLPYLFSGVAYAAVGTSSPENWFADASCTNNGDGLAQSCAASPGASGAFNSLQNVVWTATTGVDDGDTLYVCGAHSHSYLAVSSTAAGSSSSPITISFDCPGNDGSILASTIMSEALTAGNWTNESGNIWYLSTASYAQKRAQRLKIDGVEQFPASIKANLGTNEGTGAALAKWWDDSVNNRIYFYSIGNPAGLMSSLETLVSTSAGATALSFLNNNNQYFTVINPRLSGGNLGAIEVLAADNITITGTSFTRCNVGNFSPRALVVLDSAGNGSGNPSTNITVQGCKFDLAPPSNFHSHNWQWSLSSISQTFGDCIAILYNVDSITIQDMYIKDCGHDAVNITSNQASGNATNIIVRRNYISLYGVEYGRAFETSGSADGKVGSTVQITSNIVDGQPVRTQINGDHVQFIGNLYMHQRQGSSSPTAVQSVDFEGFTGVVSHDHLVANTTLVDNTYGPCFSIRAGANTKSGIIFRNNVLLGCGGTAIGGTQNNTAFFIDNSASVGSQTFQNNDIYHSTNSTPVYYKAIGQMSVSAFQAACSGDVCTNNISSDPLFMSGPNDYRPSASSPLRGTGMTYSGCIGIYGRSCFTPVTIGAFPIYSPNGATSRVR